MNNAFSIAEHSLIGDIWTSPTAWHSLRALCDDFNGRFTASDDERKAAAFIAGQLRAYGLSDVHTEAFPVHGWKRGPASLTARFTASPCPAPPPAISPHR